jgi:hypothetical protein
MTWAARGVPRHVALPRCKMVSGAVPSCRVTSPTAVPVSGQPRGTALLSGTVAAYPHVLQDMMTLSVCTSYRRLGNARAGHGNRQA